MKRDRAELWLVQMLDACEQIIDFIKELLWDAYRTDARTRQAVALNLLFIGEAAAKILEHRASVAQSAANILWTQLRGLRNIIAHDYVSLELESLWTVASIRVPELAKWLKPLIGRVIRGEL